MAKVNGLQKAIFGVMIVAGALALLMGSSTSISCLCPTGVVCLCPDNTLIYKVIGVIILGTGMGLWAFQAFRRVRIAN